jgi:hypothetical protein
MRYTTIGTGSPAAREVSVISLGAMRFGTRTDEATSFAILDRYVAAGGNFIDTSNNHLFLAHGSTAPTPGPTRSWTVPTTIRGLRPGSRPFSRSRRKPARSRTRSSWPG